MKIELVLTAQQVSEEKIKGELTVAIDTFRATTTILSALANGIEEVIPVASIEEALSYQGSSEDLIVAGERNGEQIAELDLGNSPLDYLQQQIKAQRLVLTTTNGTQLLVNLNRARQVLIAAFLNLSSVAQAVQEEEKLIICCAGSRGEFSLEDFLTAGALIVKLKELRLELELSDLALIASQSYLTNQKGLEEVLKKSQHGKRMIALNKEADLDYALQQDILSLTPYYSAGTIKKNN